MFGNISIGNEYDVTVIVVTLNGIALVHSDVTVDKHCLVKLQHADTINSNPGLS